MNIDDLLDNVFGKPKQGETSVSVIKGFESPNDEHNMGSLASETDSSPMVRVALERLHKPVSVIDEIPVPIDEKIDYAKIANSTEFKRFVYFIYTGKTHRGSSESLKKDLIKFKQESQLIQDYREVMKELKETLKERRID